MRGTYHLSYHKRHIHYKLLLPVGTSRSDISIGWKTSSLVAVRPVELVELHVRGGTLTEKDMSVWGEDAGWRLQGNTTYQPDEWETYYRLVLPEDTVTRQCHCTCPTPRFQFGKKSEYCKYPLPIMESPMMNHWIPSHVPKESTVVHSLQSGF